ncbi:MAG: VanW family protein [Actinomycetia bacterium]|nr:VanW family protein [Actinomycetes bacterium]
MTAASRHRPGRKRRRALLIVGSLVAVLALAVLIDSALYYGKVHAGVSVAGRSLGGLTHDEAVALVTRVTKETGNSAVVLESGDKKWTVTPADVGAKVDIAGAVAAALDVSRKSNFLIDLGRRFTLFFDGEDIPLQGTLDTTLLDALLGEVAQKLDVPPVDAGLAIEGDEITVVEGRKGLVVDRDALAERLRSLLLTFQAAELPVPMVVAEPALRVDETQEAVEQAKIMISAPVVLRADSRVWSLTPEQIAAYMDFTAVDRDGVSTLVCHLSADRMGPFLKDLAASVDKAPVDATFGSNGEQAWVIPSAVGKTLDHERTAEALTAAALKTSARTTTAVLVTVQPDLTTEEAGAMGIEDLLGTFTTKWEGTEDRQTNVRITTQYASNVILAPGEVYDFDKQIGPRTEARGYKLAPGITKGELEDVLGGGICQVSTTLFNAAFFAGLEIVERKNHSIYIDHYPKGRDATVSAGGPNIRFRNDTAHHILVRGHSDGITTTFNIYGSDDGRTVSHTTGDFYDEVEMATYEIPAYWLGPGTTYVKIAGQPGKSIKVERTVKAKDGSVLHKDTFVSTWKMITREIEVGTGPTTTTTQRRTTTTQPSSTTGSTGPPPSGGGP